MTEYLGSLLRCPAWGAGVSETVSQLYSHVTLLENGSDLHPHIKHHAKTFGFHCGLLLKTKGQVRAD